MDKLQTSIVDSNVGAVPITRTPSVDGGFVQMKGDEWYRITNSHLMPPFFLSLVSSGNHWMFVASNGALSAGRQNPESSLFPYYSSDKILDMRQCTGPVTLVSVRDELGVTTQWQPFSPIQNGRGERSQNLYKNSLGNRILFEEVHHSLGLRFRYSWAFGRSFGFIRECHLINESPSSMEIEIVDGLQNILPSGLGNDFQLRYSNLGDAYKKNERLGQSPLAVFYLSSIPTDRAEPSEGLQATAVWQTGLDNPTTALSSTQLDGVRAGIPLESESDVRGRRGAYLVSSRICLNPSEVRRWHIVADVNQDHTDIVSLQHRLECGEDMSTALEQDIDSNEQQLLGILSAADGRQTSANRLRGQRHQSNVLFNVMRGGIPLQDYQVCTTDFRNHVCKSNLPAWQRNNAFFESLPESLDLEELRTRVEQTDDATLSRLAAEYLPLRFSRRHGDPTRPWNRFSIDLWDEKGDVSLSYEGNWRDIFQNWEALACSYPNFTLSMVFRFLNASTADGYNPYRITKDGFEWEEPDPSDPWANIGYWGDHQIIYLLKLLGRCRDQSPASFSVYLARACCTYADIPYRIRAHEEICRNPQETIDFDEQHARAIQRRVDRIGNDGKLLTCDTQQPHQVSLLEKLLIPALTKLTNFVPEGGVWLNTQRPEWNDANNALVGRGLSVVTTCHLRRYLAFMVDLLSDPDQSIPQAVSFSRIVAELVDRLSQVLVRHRDAFENRIDDVQRRDILNELAMAGSDYRSELYNGGMCAGNEDRSVDSLVSLFKNALRMIDQTIATNRREDGMYHSYNLLQLDQGTASVSHLQEMLEGQVAVLDSGLLSPAAALDVLDSLRNSEMYREDQCSYMLYPDRELPRFIEKNRIPHEEASQSQLLQRLLDEANHSLVIQDRNRDLHFNSGFRNAGDLNLALDQLQIDPSYSQLVCNERKLLSDLFENTFGHASFTGRSGTFFGYEGLGSIYWHMVSKLSLAAMQHCIQANEGPPEDAGPVLHRLHEHYRSIRDGLGLTKTPSQYGAFPADPYSHTPRHAGVQQPGMTGQVKEDVLSRWDEIGIRIRQGVLRFDPVFFEKNEFADQGTALDFYDLKGSRQTLPVAAGSFAFTFCQVPIVYIQSERQQLSIHHEGQPATQRSDLALTEKETSSLFSRRGDISLIEVLFDPGKVLLAAKS